MGFPEGVIGKSSIYFRPETLVRDILLIISTVVIVVTLIVLLFGCFFSHRLAKPLVKIINGIQSSAKGNYQDMFKPKGIYKSVFQNLNELSFALKSNEAERRKIEKMREEWVTHITHDIKTPLASIRGYSELTQEYEMDDTEKERYVDIILDKSDYIERLIEDLNLTYQLQSTSFPLKKEEHDFVDVVRESIVQILNHPLYEETNLDFSTEIEMCVFPCNRTLMQRALMNLIFNAIVHNPAGTWIEIKFQERQDHVQVFIEDYGKGIAEEELFTRYYRGTNIGETHKGSGLGLAIAKQVVEAHDGEIFVESQLGEGTRVRIVFKK